MISNFLDRPDTMRKPTLALEYSFGRRTGGLGQGIQKQICNVWELGSLSNSQSLINVPIKSHGLMNFAAIIVLNLQHPDRLWSDLEASLNGLKQGISSYQTSELTEKLKQNAVNRVGMDHPDLSTLELFALPTVIVGGFYDKFQDFGELDSIGNLDFSCWNIVFADPAIKKHVGRCLRSIAHTLGAALIYHSSQHSSLSKTLRDTFSHFGFNSPSKPFRTVATDYNEPLIIWFGQDSWQQIGVGPSNSERIAVTYNKQIPQVESDSVALPADPAKDINFREAVIDELRVQKDEELLRLIKESDIRSKFQSVSMLN